MSDLTRTAAGLENYRDVLTTHRQRVGEAFSELSSRYSALSEVYDGTGAREFDQGWRQAQEAFDAYVEHTPGLLQLLSVKIESLRQLDRGLS